MALGSTYAKNIALAACYGANKSTLWPSTLYGHLYVADPTSGGTELTSLGGYAPIAITNDGVNFPPPSGGYLSNGAAWTFAASSGAWSGVGTYFWLTDALGVLPPGALSLTQAGTAGSTPYSYQVTALNSAGESTPSPTGTITTGNATLSGTNYNIPAWTAVSGATSYNVYRLVSGLFQLVGNTASTSFHDTGGATTAQTPPVVNTTSNLLDGGPLPSNQTVIVTQTLEVVQFAPGALVIGD